VPESEVARLRKESVVLSAGLSGHSLAWLRMSVW
jgi:hypothetical protein